MKENKRLGRNVIRSVQIVHHQGVEVPDFPRIEKVLASHVLYSRRRHFTGQVFEVLGDIFPTFGAHLIAFAVKV